MSCCFCIRINDIVLPDNFSFARRDAIYRVSDTIGGDAIGGDAMNRVSTVNAVVVPTNDDRRIISPVRDGMSVERKLRRNIHCRPVRDGMCSTSYRQ
jgi:hypothetical protein